MRLRIRTLNNRARKNLSLRLTQLENRLAPATFNVNTIADSGAGSLRQAVADANSTLGADDIVFDSTFFAAPHTISLLTALPTITEDVNIIGTTSANCVVKRDITAGAIRIFASQNFFTANTITISNLTIQGGSSNYGGGINAGIDNLTLANCVVSNNIASFSGGGIYMVDGSTATLSLTNCTISSNAAGSRGGAIYAPTGTLVMDGSTLSGNTASGVNGGGGIYFSANNATIRNSTISGNTGTRGGGIEIATGGNVTVQNCTIANNSANVSGGGINVAAGTLTIESTIVAKNSASGTGRDINGSVTANYSLVGVANDGPSFTATSSNNKTGTAATPLNPLLGSLANNGGLTQTLALLAGSPAVDAGSNPAILSTDQRGADYVRAFGSQADIGAFETQTVNYVVLNANGNGIGSLLQAILNANANIGADTITFEPSFFSTPRTITLTTLQLAISDAVTISGPGANLTTVSGNFTFDVFNTSGAPANAPINISGLSMTAAKTAILVADEALTLTNCIVSNCTSGGVVVFGGSVTARGSEFSRNQASAIALVGVGSTPGGSLLLENCTLSGNSAGANGGGIYFKGAVGAGGFTIRNSTISSNTAYSSASGITANGGGIVLSNVTGTVTIQNSTIVFNSAGGVATGNTGGGISQLGGSVTINLESTIVTGNVAPYGLDIYSTGVVNVKTSAIGSAVGFNETNLDGNLPFGVNAKLGALADNGGPTLTHALLPGSPCINKGSNPAALTTDQRGFARVYGAAADIGAVEAFTTKVTSLTRIGSALTNAASVQWIANFDHDVSGLNADNFNLVGAGASGASISSVTGAGSSWTVTAATGSDGALGLNLVNSSDAADPAGNPIGYLPFYGEGFTVDLTAPQVSGINRIGSSPTNAASVQWAVTITESITGMVAGNFTLVNSGLGGSPAITNVSGSGASWTITASTGTGTGTLGLNLTTADLIIDAAGNPLIGVPMIGQIFAIDSTAPTVVLSSNLAVINDYKVGSNMLALTATFSEGMDVASTPVFDFPVENPSLSLGFAGGSWSDSIHYQANYNVFDLNLNLQNIDVRVTGGKDLAGNLFGSFTKADLLSLDTQNPIVVSITRNDPSPTNLAAVGWTVTLSEPVTGLSVSNFTLFNGGLVGSPAITLVSGGGTTWTVTANTGTGEGTLALCVVDASGVTDVSGNPLAALPVIGAAYSIDHVAPQAAKVTTNTLTVTDFDIGPAGFQATSQYNEPMNQAVQPTVSFPVENPAPTLSFASGVWLDAKTYRATFGVSDFGLSLQDVDVQFSGAQDAVGNIQGALTITDLFDIDMVSPTVSKVIINGGNNQRSRVTSVAVVLDRHVTFASPPESAFLVTRQSDGKQPALTAFVDDSGSATTVTLSFSGTTAVDFGSLADGRYTLNVIASKVTSGGGILDGDGNGTGGDNYVFASTLIGMGPPTNIFRFFGDATGDGSVAINDFNLFRSSFGGSDDAFDFDGDGSVAISDFTQFRSRFGGSI